MTKNKSSVETHVVEGQTKEALQSWLTITFIYSESRQLDLKDARGKIKEGGLNWLHTGKLDYYSVIVSKVEDSKDIPLTKDEETKLKGCFEYVVPWHKEYCLRLISRYELIGIPL